MILKKRIRPVFKVKTRKDGDVYTTLESDSRRADEQHLWRTPRLTTQVERPKDRRGTLTGTLIKKRRHHRETTKVFIQKLESSSKRSTREVFRVRFVGSVSNCPHFWTKYEIILEIDVLVGTVIRSTLYLRPNPVSPSFIIDFKSRGRQLKPVTVYWGGRER